MAYTIPSAAAWPTALERERSLSWQPDFGNEASPQALDGTRQYRNGNGGGLWRATFNGVALRSPEHRRAWLAVEVRLRGGMTPIDVPLLFCGDIPKHADKAATVIKTVGAWAARAPSGRVDIVHGGTLTEGMHFSVRDATTYGWRLHRIDSVTAVGGHPTQWDLTWWPLLRFAVADNYALEWDNPRCVMRLAKSDAMDVEFDYRKRGDPSAEFEEAY